MTGAGGRLADLAVEGAALEEMIEFHFLQTSGSIGALFVASADVAGRGFTLGLSLRAFENDDFTCHKFFGGARLGYSLLKSRDSFAP